MMLQHPQALFRSICNIVSFTNGRYHIVWSATAVSSPTLEPHFTQIGFFFLFTQIATRADYFAGECQWVGSSRIPTALFPFFCDYHLFRFVWPVLGYSASNQLVLLLPALGLLPPLLQWFLEASLYLSARIINASTDVTTNSLNRPNCDAIPPLSFLF